MPPPFKTRPPAISLTLHRPTFRCVCVCVCVFGHGVTSGSSALVRAHCQVTHIRLHQQDLASGEASAAAKCSPSDARATADPMRRAQCWRADLKWLLTSRRSEARRHGPERRCVPRARTWARVTQTDSASLHSPETGCSKTVISHSTGGGYPFCMPVILMVLFCLSHSCRGTLTPQAP